VAAILRQLVPIAKAPLFRHPLVGPILRLVGAIPVHRRQEGLAATEPARNALMFARAIETLRGGAGILIFPEGMSQPEPTLMPLRTGVARLVLGAERAEPGFEVPCFPSASSSTSPERSGPGGLSW
jgi:glycerol-3-phosphate O-acyltransferase / dihydroxyacetone phosphate acyltransferase